mmetsp:Transcript_10663/g.15723  ORF Transcript_10663/g.15723 Transcript_10663/m.15723 type:complete len:289 (-) Transcript_10663:331-1197(-)
MVPIIDFILFALLIFSHANCDTVHSFAFETSTLVTRGGRTLDKNSRSILCPSLNNWGACQWLQPKFHQRSGINLALSPSPQVVEETVLAISGGEVDAAPIIDELGSAQDIAIGVVIAFVIAFSYSFLQGQSSSSNIVLWPNQRQDVVREERVESDAESDETVSDDGDIVKKKVSNEDKRETVFGSDSWKEISRPENYVLYNTRVKNKDTTERSIFDIFQKQDERNVTGSAEKKWVLIALLILFVPIFSVEFFFALSRQFMCGGVFGGDPFSTQQPTSAWAQEFCSPHL